MKIDCFNTDTVRQDRRLSYWTAANCATHGPLRIVPKVREFHADLTRLSLSQLVVSVIRSAPVHVEICRHVPDPRRGWYLMYFEQGHGELMCGKKLIEAPRTSYLVIDAADLSEMEFAVATTSVVIHVPIAAMPPDFAPVVGQPRPVTDVPLLAALLGQMSRSQLMTPEAGPLLQRCVLDVIQLAHARSAVQRPRSMPDWTATFRDHIAQNFADTDLGARSIAKDFEVSVRFVHKVFEESGMPCSSHMIAIRLDRAAHMLRSNIELPVAEIALRCGFGDISYFCRKFRARFGCAASGYRNAAGDMRELQNAS